MENNVVYLESGRRKPVRIGSAFGLRDIQGEIPRGWCIRCGGEVYRAGSLLCSRCLEERRKENERKCGESLLQLYQGERSGSMRK